MNVIPSKVVRPENWILSPCLASAITSAPSPTANVNILLPSPPVKLSLPAPPEIPSLPAPPRIVSLPAPPINTSAPAPPSILSAPAPPINQLVSAVPVMSNVPKPHPFSSAVPSNECAFVTTNCLSAGVTPVNVNALLSA